MTRILLTAFEPYEVWPTNASWLVVQELLRDLSPDSDVTTRLYPVCFDKLRERLAEDLPKNFDVVLMLGQAPGYTRIELETIGLNLALEHGQPADAARLLVEGGPVAYETELPLGEWARELRRQGVPSTVSYHAGTFLCNAAMYLCHHYIEQLSLPTQAAFIHIPLDFSQTSGQAKPMPSMPVQLSAAAVEWMMNAAEAHLAT